MADLFWESSYPPYFRDTPRILDGHPSLAPLASFDLPAEPASYEVLEDPDQPCSSRTVYYSPRSDPPAGEIYLQQPGQAMFENMTGHEVVAAVFWQRRAVLMWWKTFAQPGQAIIQSFWSKVVTFLGRGLMVGALPISLWTCKRDQIRGEHYWVTKDLALWGQPESWQKRVRSRTWNTRDQGALRLHRDLPMTMEVSDPEFEEATESIKKSVVKVKQYRKKWGRRLDRLTPQADYELGW